MRLTNSLLSYVFVFLITAPLACGQSLPAGVAASAQQPKLSPGAEEIARTIGVVPLIERFYGLPELERGVGGGVMSMEAMSLRQQITENVVGAGLEVDGMITEIDSELAEISAVRAQLEDRRDRALAIGNLANIVTGGATGVVGTAMQLSDATTKAGNIIGVAGGAVSTVLSLVGLRQQRGGKLPLGVTPNMLAKLFRPGAGIPQRLSEGGLELSERYSAHRAGRWDSARAIDQTMDGYRASGTWRCAQSAT
jgi:hypothetical protein